MVVVEGQEGKQTQIVAVLLWETLHRSKDITLSHKEMKLLKQEVTYANSTTWK